MNKVPNNTDEDNSPIVFGFLIMPNFSLIAYVLAIEVLRLANNVKGEEIYQWELLSPTDDKITASNGLDFTPDRKLEDAQDYEILFVCGGNNIQQYWIDSIGKWLRLQDKKGMILGSLCSGAYVLGRADLLDGYRCTMHWDHIAATREEFPHLQLTDDIYEIDRNRYTCSGGTASIDMMIHLITLQQGRRLASAVGEKLMVDHIRGMGDPQRIPLRQQIGTNQPKLTEAVRLMESNLEECLSPKELADYVGLSVRQLERSFRSSLDCTPMQYYLRLRLRNARRLILQTEKPITSISVACGFKSSPHFSKSYKDLFKISPREERQMILKYDP